MNNQDTLNSNLELEKKFYKLQKDYEDLNKKYEQSIRLFESADKHSREYAQTISSFVEFLKQELLIFKEAYDKAKQSRVSAKAKSESHGKAGESHYYYTPTEVADSHIELKRVAIDFCNKLLNHKLIK